LQIIQFVGIVSTGQERGKFFVAIPWVIRQIKELTGFTPHPGTLNLRLTPDCTKQRTCLTQQNGILVKPENGYLPGYLYNAVIFDTKCYVVLPDIPHYPKELLEIIAAENLRDLFNIEDGDTITVVVTL
jgi:riboflavin kinase